VRRVDDESTPQVTSAGDGKECDSWILSGVRVDTVPRFTLDLFVWDPRQTWQKAARFCQSWPLHVYRDSSARKWTGTVRVCLARQSNMSRL